MRIFLMVLAIAFLVIVLGCLWKTAEAFSEVSDTNKHRGILAWDALVLFFVAIALIMRIVTM